MLSRATASSRISPSRTATSSKITVDTVRCRARSRSSRLSVLVESGKTLPRAYTFTIKTGDKRTIGQERGMLERGRRRLAPRLDAPRAERRQRCPDRMHAQPGKHQGRVDREKKLAGAYGNRTHQEPVSKPLTGFEDRAWHQPRTHSRLRRKKTVYDRKRRKSYRQRVRRSQEDRHHPLGPRPIVAETTLRGVDLRPPPERFLAPVETNLLGLLIGWGS